MNEQALHALSAAVPAEWREKVINTPISVTTLLATDYLNHFNEVIMLIGMVPSMPEIMADVDAWREKSYAAHFRGSNLDYGELAAAAYDHVPQAFKVPFEDIVDRLNQIIRAVALRLNELSRSAKAEDLAATAKDAVAVMMNLIAAADGIIAGGRQVLDQAEIDKLLESVDIKAGS